MKRDEDKPKEQLTDELAELRQHIAKLKKAQTERKQAEAELRGQRDHLEQLVEERTARLKEANEQLQRQLTERKTAEDAISISEARFRELFNNMSSGVAVYEARENGEDFVFVDFNRAGERIDRVKKEDAIGKSVLEAFPGVKDFGLFDIFQRVSRTGKPEHFPVSMYQDQRITGWRDNYIYKLPSGEIVAIYEDVTEQKQTEEALRESEERFRTLADFTYDWEWWLDPDGNAIYVSPSCERITGYSADEFCRNPRLLETIAHPNDHDAIARHIKQESAANEALHIDFRIITRSGEERWICHMCRVVVDPQGKRLGRRGSNRDITERSKAELQVEQSLREKEVLLREINHRVKNNIQVISSLLNLQSRQTEDERTVQMFKDSRGRVKAIALVHEKLYQFQDLTNIDFSDYTRSLTGDLFNAYSVNRNAVKLEIHAEHARLDVNAAIPCGLIINELVSNCLKHAFPNGRRGAIRIELHSHNNDFTLTVSDTGIGFPDLDFRNTQTLGLQLVSTLVQQLRGTIELDRNGGTTFRVKFQKVAHEERQ